MNKKSMLLAAAGLALVGAGVASPVSADPTTTGRLLNGVGSDTTQNVMNGFSQLAAGSNIASWNATGSATFDSGNSGCGTVTRSNGSGAGRSALLGTAGGPAACIQFARSSSFSANAGLTFYPFAEDGLTYAVAQNSSLPKSLTKAEIIAIYRCEVDGVVPVLPQTGSGSRNDWLTHVFGATAFPPAGVTTSCYLGSGTDNSVLPQEHDGRQLTTTQVMPYSVANWISQMTSVISDVRGKAVLGLYDTGSGATSPVMLNPNGANTRTVFNVVKRADATAIDASLGVDGIANTGDDVNSGLTDVQLALKQAFVGPNSVLCQNTSTTINYGFAPVKSGATFACGAPRTS